MPGLNHRLYFSLAAGGKIPTKGSKGAAAWDLYARIDVNDSHWIGYERGTDDTSAYIMLPHGSVIYGMQVTRIPLGVKFEIPQGYYGQLCARSSSGARGIAVPNGVGVIDSDFRGEVCILMQNFTGQPQTIRDGDRIAQILFLELPTFELVQGALSDTERGEGGFGSTGRGATIGPDE